MIRSDPLMTDPSTTIHVAGDLYLSLGPDPTLAPRLARIETILTSLQSTDRALVAQGAQLMSLVDDVKTRMLAMADKIAKLDTLEQGIKALLEGISAQNAALKDQIAALLAQGVDPTLVQPLLDQIDANNAGLDAVQGRLAADLTANTPAA